MTSDAVSGNSVATIEFQSITSAEDVSRLLRTGDWKLVSVTKGDGFPGDPEFVFWMVHRVYA